MTLFVNMTVILPVRLQYSLNDVGKLNKTVEGKQISTIYT